MTIELLIHALVRQTTILIAQLATSGGTRAPLAQVASQVFLDLVHELERQGVSRKVSADMFGLGLRTYQRKIQRLTESSTDRGRSLWVAVLDHVAARGSITRAELFLHFSGDDETLLRGVVHDLCESALITADGAGASISYRVTSEDELTRLRQVRENEGLDELIWALIYREGPLSLEQLSAQQIRSSELAPALERLLASGRVELSERTGLYSASELYLPLGSTAGWEAAIFDHFKAMVNTITGRLRGDRSAAKLADRVGGSTYTLEVWPGHPFEQEAYDTLGALREKLSELRSRIEDYNAKQSLPEEHTQVLLYVGQCLIAQEDGGTGDNE
jgi:hypothetical protein